MKTMQPPSARRAILTAVLLAPLSGIATLPSASAAEPATAPATAPASGLTAEMRQHLVGQWLRPDGGYILNIESVADNGMITATYLNPRPISIFKALATIDNAAVSIYVELRDRGYPGNYYTLKYDSARDQLVGIYTHLGIGQKFEVFFEHVSKDPKPRE